VRQIDASLNVPKRDRLHEYLAQDFWVYLGQRDGKAVDYLKGMVEAGSTAPDVDQQIFTHFGSRLADEYWRWVKNQFMLEDGINFFPDGRIGFFPPPLDKPPCVCSPRQWHMIQQR
jgi:hypothetical protein